MRLLYGYDLSSSCTRANHESDVRRTVNGEYLSDTAAHSTPPTQTDPNPPVGGWQPNPTPRTHIYILCVTESALRGIDVRVCLELGAPARAFHCRCGLTKRLVCVCCACACVCPAKPANGVASSKKGFVRPPHILHTEHTDNMHAVSVVYSYNTLGQVYLIHTQWRGDGRLASTSLAYILYACGRVEVANSKLHSNTGFLLLLRMISG